MNFLDLFAGIGGFRLGMEQAGHECVGYVEIDKFARKSYQAIHDTEGEWTAHDITSVTDGDLRFLRGKGIDVICGGFPCQAFSVAGKRGGFEDSRGTLFFEMARIAKEKQPKVVLAENVKGLVSHDKGKTLDTIVKTLNDIGYRVDFNILNSKYFGVPQNRERIFIVGIREDIVDNEPWRIDAKDKTIVPKGKRRIIGYPDVKTFNFDWPEQGEVTTRLRDILEQEVDEKYYLSEEKTAKLVAQLNEDLPAHFPTPNDVNNTIRTGGKGSLTAKHNYDHVAEPQMLGHIHDGYRIRKLTPRECWRLQGFPDWAFDKAQEVNSDSQLYKQAGNSVTVNVIYEIVKRF